MIQLFMLEFLFNDQVVDKSRGYRVEALERLYSMLSQGIYHHRREYDKTQLLVVRLSIGLYKG